MYRILFLTTLCCLVMMPAAAKERLKGVKLQRLERVLKKNDEKERERQTSSPTAFPSSAPTSTAVPEESLTTLEQACLAAAEDKVFTTDSSQDIVFQFEVLTTDDDDPSDVANVINGGMQSFLISELVEPNCVNTRRLRDLTADAIRGVSVVSQDDGSNKSCSQLQPQSDNELCYSMSSLAKIYYEQGATMDESEVVQKTNALLEIKFNSNSDPAQGVLDTAYGSSSISPVQDGDRNAGNQGKSGGDDSMGPAGIFFLTLLCVCIVIGSALFVVRRRRLRQSKEKEDDQANDGDDSSTLANVLSEEDAHTFESGSVFANVVSEDDSFVSDSTREVLKVDTIIRDLSASENIIHEEPDFLDFDEEGKMTDAEMVAADEEGMECGYDEKSLDDSTLPPPPPPPIEDHPAYKPKLEFPTNKDNVDLDFHAIGDNVNVSFTSSVDDDAEQFEVSFAM